MQSYLLGFFLIARFISTFTFIHYFNTYPNWILLLLIPFDTYTELLISSKQLGLRITSLSGPLLQIFFLDGTNRFVAFYISQQCFPLYTVLMANYLWTFYFSLFFFVWLSKIRIEIVNVASFIYLFIWLANLLPWILPFLFFSKFCWKMIFFSNWQTISYLYF
jgi:hypothetical protein